MASSAPNGHVRLACDLLFDVRSEGGHMRITGRVLVAAALCTLIAGCGSGYDSPTAPDGGGQTPPPSGASTVAIVGDRGAQSFNPNPVTLGSGRMVSWRNSDGTVHRIVANDGSFDTGNIAAGATSGAITLSTDGANYHCSLHPGMIGAISAASGVPPPCMGQYC
jgi:plastocyanin